MLTEKFQPAMRNGVTASKVFLPLFPQTSQPHLLIDFLIEQFPHIDANEWQQRFQEQLILDQNGKTLSIDTPYSGNQHIFYYRFLAHEITVPFEHQILAENEHLLVVDKPHFLTMSPTGQYVQQTLLVRLKQQTGLADLTPIHRLDRETAGVVLFSKQPSSRGVYQQLFADKKVQKTYEAIAPYIATLKFPHTVTLRMEKGEPFYTMRVIDGTANSETTIGLAEHKNGWARYVLHPKTGKQHQLRVHLNHLGIPIQHDPFYPKVQHKADDDFSQPLQLLAKSIRFIDPITNQERYFESEQHLNL